MPSRPKFSLLNSLSGRLLRVIFSFYCVVTIVVTLFQMFVEYSDASSSAQEEMVTYQRLLAPLLRIGLLKKSSFAVQKVIDSVVDSGVVAYAEISDMNGRTWYAGIEHSGALVEYSFTLHDQGEVALAQVTFKAPAIHVYHQLLYSFAQIILGAIVKTAALWLLFFWAGYRYLSKPLWALTRATARIQSGHLAKVKLSKSHQKATEIDLLERGFNTMVDELGATRRRLEETQERLADIINAMPTAIICIDDQGIVLDWNQTAHRISGIDPASAIGRSLETVYAPFEVYMPLVRRALEEGQEQKDSSMILHIEGEDKYYDVLVYPLISKGFTGAVIRLDDVSMRVQFEKSIVQSEKLSSIGSLAAGMAHEINNPLGIILQGVQNISRRLDPTMPANLVAATECGVNLEAMTNYLQQRNILNFLQWIRESGERASNIVVNLLQFSRRTNTNHVPIHIEDLLHKAIELARVDYCLEQEIDFRKIEIEIESEAELPTVFACPMEIEQVFLNVLKNASHAMKATIKPRIEIKISAIDTKVQVQMRDNGSGIPEHCLKKIFEPFYTTKPVGEGTGLGLSVSYGIIVESHHGEMFVTSKEGVGTTFTIRLPL